MEFIQLQMINLPSKYQTRLILALGVIFVTSSSFIFLEADKDPYAIAFIRVFFTGLISYFILQQIDTNNEYPVSWHDLRSMIFAGIALATHFGWWFDSLQFIDVGISLSLTNTAPIWMAIFLYLFYSKRPQKRQIVSMVLVIIGSSLLFSQDTTIGSDKLKGLILAMGSAIGFAIYLLTARNLVHKIGLWRYFGIVNLSSASMLFIWLIVQSKIGLLFEPEIWFWGFILAFFPGILGHAVYNWSMSKLDPIDVGVATLGEPVLGTSIAWIFLEQVLVLNEILAFLALIIAIAFTIEFKPEKPN